MPRVLDLSIWYEALGSPSGVIVECSDTEKAKQKLYTLRRESGDKDLESIAIMTSPTNPTKDLWLVKKGKDSSAT